MGGSNVAGARTRVSERVLTYPFPRQRSSRGTRNARSILQAGYQRSIRRSLFANWAPWESQPRLRTRKTTGRLRAGSSDLRGRQLDAEHLHAVIVGVGHVDVSLSVYCYPPRLKELTVAVAL